MKSSFTKPLILICLAVLLLHFSFTLVYVLPHSWFSNSAINWANSYMYPGFYQGWSLFAPDVAEWQAELEYRTFKEGSWSEWKSTSTGPNNRHHPKVREAAEKLNHYLGIQIHENLYEENGRKSYQNATLQGHYKAAVHYCRMHYEREGIVQPDSLQLRLEVEYFQAFESPSENRIELYPYPKIKVPKP